MGKYFCYKKHPEWFTLHCEASYPAYKEFLTFDQWLALGKPTDGSIHFLGVGNQPPQLKAYWEKKKEVKTNGHDTG